MRVIETRRLYLRHLGLDDSKFILELLNDPSFIKNIGDRGARTLDDAAQYILKIQKSYDQFGFGLFLVELKDSATSSGICGLIKRDSLDDVDVGFAFMPQFWRQGFAFESTQAVVNYAKNKHHLKKIVAITSPDNIASIAVLKKLGMNFERMVKMSESEPEIKLFSMTLF